MAPLRLDPFGRLVYVQLSTGEQVGISDANDEVGLLAQVHPTHDHDDRLLPPRYVRHDGVEVVEVTTRDDRGGRTVGPTSYTARGTPPRQES